MKDNLVKKYVKDESLEGFLTSDNIKFLNEHKKLSRTLGIKSYFEFDDLDNYMI